MMDPCPSSHSPALPSSPETSSCSRSPSPWSPPPVRGRQRPRHLPAGGGEAGVTVTEAVFVAIRVRDVEAVADWYTRVFGLEVKKTLDGEGGAFSIRILGNHMLTVELIEQIGTEEPPERHHGLFKAGFFVDSAARALEQLRSAGAVASDEQVTVFVDEPLAVRSFLLRDPEGNRLQFFERCGDSC